MRTQFEVAKAMFPCGLCGLRTNQEEFTSSSLQKEWQQLNCEAMHQF
jgi:hypothetical protein